MSTFNVEHEVDMGAAGDITLEVGVDTDDYMDTEDYLSNVEPSDLVNHFGERVILDEVSYGAIVDFLMEHNTGIELVVKALEAKYNGAE